MQKIKAKNIDEYIAAFPKDVQAKLNEIREVIRKAAPKAEEAIKYGIPTYVLHGNLVHFGGFKNHLGFYPAPQGIQEFKKELSVYKGSKGAIQFPYDQPLPKGLITKIVKFRIAKTLEKQSTKVKAK
jgi:uncharacterized protein YdhG (YjbR/CyaY superfamily)